MKKHAKYHSRNPNTPSFNLGCLIGGALPLFFIIAGFGFAYSAFEERLSTESTDGIVIGFEEDFERRENSGSFSYRPIAEYVVAGKTHRCTTSSSYGSRFWLIGEHLPVRYMPDHPESGFIDSFFDTWGASLFLVFYGAGFLFLVYVGSRYSSVTESKVPRIWWLQFMAGQVFCFMFLVPGFVLLIAAYRQNIETQEATATIIDVHEANHGEIHYRPIIEYEVGGKRFVCRHLNWTTERPKVGSKVQIEYSTENPQGVITESMAGRWASAILLLIAGAIPELATVVYLIRRMIHAKDRTH